MRNRGLGSLPPPPVAADRLFDSLSGPPEVRLDALASPWRVMTVRWTPRTVCSEVPSTQPRRRTRDRTRSFFPFPADAGIEDRVMEDHVATYLGVVWVLTGLFFLYTGWSSQSTASVFRTSLSVTLGVLMLLGGAALLLYVIGLGQEG